MNRPQGYIDIQIVGDRHGVQAMLNQLDSAVSPVGLAAFLKLSVAPFLRERAEGRFASEGDDASGRWAPLAPATQEIRARGEWGVSASHPINVRTGELEAYITQSDSAVMPIPTGSQLTYPSKPPRNKGLKQKVETAQRGRAYPKTVARPVLTVSERDLLATMTMLAFHVKDWKGGRAQ